MRIIKFVTILVTFLVFGFVESVSAETWYAGNRRNGGAYGVKALIWTPSTAPYIDTGGQSNWVSLPAENFVQAGWRYYSWYTTAQKYREYNDSCGYNAIDLGTHAWNTSIEYKLNHVAGEIWSIYIAGTLIGSYNCIRTAPTDGLAFSEVHDSSNNELNTNFNSVRRRNPTGYWILFDQDNFDADPPYAVEVIYNYKFRTYGP